MCAFCVGLFWLRPPRALAGRDACRGYQSASEAAVNTLQPKATEPKLDSSGERVVSSVSAHDNEECDL